MNAVFWWDQALSEPVETNRPVPNPADEEQVYTELRRQKDLLEHTIESLTHPFFVIDAKSLEVQISNSAARNMDDIFGQVACYALHWDGHRKCGTQDHLCPVDTVIRTKQPIVIEHLCRDKQGGPRNVEVHAYPIFDEFGEVVEIIEYWLDVTEQRQALENMRLSEERYAVAQKAANIGSWDWNIVTNELIWSEQIEPLFGFEKGKFDGTYEAFIQCVHPDDRQFLQNTVDASLAGKNDYNIEHRIVWPDGSIRWMSETGDIIRDDDGTPLKMIGIVQDITERAIAEEQIENLARFPSEDPNPVLRISANGTILFSNTSGHELLKKWNCKVSGPAPQNWKQYVARILDSGIAEVMEFDIDSKVYSLTIAPVQTAGYANVYGTDITQRIKAEDNLSRYREHLEELVRERTDELSRANIKLLDEIEQRKKLEREILNISEQEQRRIGQELHDSLGQQLTGIAFMARVLEKKLLDKDMPEAANVAEIIKLVNGATNQARGLAKGLHPVDLTTGSLMSSLAELASGTQQLFGVRCDFHYDRELEITSIEKVVHLYRIAQEAVTNAIKHGRTKNIGIRIVHGSGECTLSIENDGRDFPKKFEEQGTGMGLQIMDHRVDLIGGQVTIRKGPKSGTLVTCTFPI